MLKVEIEEKGLVKRLEQMVKTAAKAYIREKASAILQVYQGINATKVAKTGLLQKRHPETVRTWVHNFNAQGISSFFIKEGRGRKAAYFP